MEYFELKKDYWISRWLKKPNKNIIVAAEKNIKKHNRMITIGISVKIIEEIITRFKNKRKKCELYGKMKDDYDEISSEMQIPKALVMLVLEERGVVIKK